MVTKMGVQVNRDVALGFICTEEASETEANNERPQKRNRWLRWSMRLSTQIICRKTVIFSVPL